MSIQVRSRAPLMIGMALILALPLVLTAAIGIYRSEHPAPAARNLVPGDEPGRDDAEQRSEEAR